MKEERKIVMRVNSIQFANEKKIKDITSLNIDQNDIREKLCDLINNCMEIDVSRYTNELKITFTVGEKYSQPIGVGGKTIFKENRKDGEIIEGLPSLDEHTFLDIEEEMFYFYREKIKKGISTKKLGEEMGCSGQEAWRKQRTCMGQFSDEYREILEARRKYR